MAHNLDWVISVDDHIIEPADVWTDRMPARFRDEAPRLISKNGNEAWLFGGKRRSVFGLTAAAGKASEEFSIDPIPYAEMRESCYNSTARIRDMDRKGIPWRRYHEINFVNINYKPFDASVWPVQPSGLEGPVTIRPLKVVK